MLFSEVFVRGALFNTVRKRPGINESRKGKGREKKERKGKREAKRPQRTDLDDSRMSKLWPKSADEATSSTRHARWSDL